jgi:hypothetical protein
LNKFNQNSISGLPHNNQFNPPDLGRHAVCLSKRRAGTFGSLLLRRRDRSPSPAG